MDVADLVHAGAVSASAGDGDNAAVARCRPWALPSARTPGHRREFNEEEHKHGQDA
jgi:hypothetical protein